MAGACFPVLCVLLVCTTLHTVAPGYIDCSPGSTNIILSAPHGGYEKPDSIPNRVAGCYEEGKCVYKHGCTPDSRRCRVSTIRDSNTKELTELLAQELYQLTNHHPHVVINNLYRGKLDPNREQDEAAFGVKEAEQAYEEYHSCIRQAKADIAGDQRIGLLIDIHGQGHPNNWAELGYAISKTSLNNSDFHASNSSIRFLALRSCAPFDEILRGDQSFGHLLEEEGFNAVPSPNHKRPGKEKYYSGGYITKVHGSRDGGTVDAIQIESSWQQRSDAVRENYAKALARAIFNYMAIHY